MKISFIIPIYKVEQYLERCVESIVNQTYKNLEIIFNKKINKDDTLIFFDTFFILYI